MRIQSCHKAQTICSVLVAVTAFAYITLENSIVTQVLCIIQIFFKFLTRFLIAFGILQLHRVQHPYKNSDIALENAHLFFFHLIMTPTAGFSKSRWDKAALSIEIVPCSAWLHANLTDYRLLLSSSGKG